MRTGNFREPCPSERTNGVERHVLLSKLIFVNHSGGDKAAALHRGGAHKDGVCSSGYELLPGMQRQAEDDIEEVQGQRAQAPIALGQMR